MSHEVKCYRLRRIAAREDGQTMIEYSILVGLIAAVVVFAMMPVSEFLSPIWQAVLDALTASPDVPSGS